MTTTSIPFGQRSGFQIPRVNIGAMRLPGKMDDAVELVRHAIDSGLKYIDTSRGYGDSEIKLGQALKDGYREKVILSTKWAPWITKIEESDDASSDCVLRRIEESMKRLEVDYLDFYQVWNIQNQENYDLTVKKDGFLDGILKAKQRGLVGHTGITSHASVEDLLRFLDDMDWCEVILLSYNVMGTGHASVLHKAKQMGIGTIVMNPVGGGKLTEDSPVFAPLLEKVGAKDMTDLALRYVLSNPDVDTIISGISRTSDVDNTLASWRSGLFTEEQVRQIEQFFTDLSPEKIRFCTNCGYCMPCPQETNIPRVMQAIHSHRVLGFARDAKQSYEALGRDEWNPGKNADACTACGECLPKCTQDLDIPAEMEFARKTWGKA